MSAVPSLTRRTATGEVLRRPAAVEEAIAEAMDLDPKILVQRASRNDADAPGYLPPECLVHLVRQHLRGGSRALMERLMTILLERCEPVLRRSVRGFSPSTSQDVRAEILGRLAVSLADPGDGADFFEVRFALALKRLTIDVCRIQRRYDGRTVAAQDLATEDETEAGALERLAAGNGGTEAFGLEEQLVLRQALGSLGEQERQVLILHRVQGVPINAQGQPGASLVDLLGVSERTIRNRLRRAEAVLRDLVEEKRCTTTS